MMTAIILDTLITTKRRKARPIGARHAIVHAMSCWLWVRGFAPLALARSETVLGQLVSFKLAGDLQIDPKQVMSQHISLSEKTTGFICVGLKAVFVFPGLECRINALYLL